MKRYGITLLFWLSLLYAQSQDITGRWKTIDDNTGKPRSIVEIYESGGMYYGKIVELFRGPDEDQDPLCDECPGDKKGKRVIGMEIIAGMKYDAEDHEYEAGEILDPESGNVYDCKLWISDEGNLKVRGYLYFLFRTQTWLPVAGE